MPDTALTADELIELLKSKGLTKPPKSSEPTEGLEDIDRVVEEGKSHAVSVPRAVTIKNLFQHPDAHPLVLDLILLRRYGHEFLTWEPETLDYVIPKDFSTGPISHRTAAKINAMKTLHLVDGFWERWEVFVWITMALNGVPPDFQVMQVPTVAQCMVAVDIANRVRTDVIWTEELKQYLATVFKHDGIFLPVPPLDFVKVSVPESIRGDLVLQKWPEVRKTGKPPTEETSENEQLRRLLIVQGFLEESQDRLREQLEILRHV